MSDQAETLRRMCDPHPKADVCIICVKPCHAKINNIPICLDCANWAEHFRQNGWPNAQN